MNRIYLYLILFSFSVLSMYGCAEQGVCAVADEEYVGMYMSGVSSESDLAKLCVTAGNMAYCIGRQNGTFPDMNGHMAYEMGGLWANPVKLADGFSMRISKGDSSILLDAPDRYTTYPYGCGFDYSADGLEIERFQFIPQDKAGMVVSYTIKNVSEETVRVKLGFSARLDVLPAWFSEQAGMIDTEDVFSVDGGSGVICSKDSGHEWYAVCVSSVSGSVCEDSVPELETKGHGHTGTFSSEAEIASGQSTVVRYAFAGSMKDAAEAVTEGRQMLDGSDRLLSEKKAHYEDLIKRSAISIPDKALQDAYTYAKINDEWLVEDLSGMHFLSAGAKEYPWLFGCDNSYSQQGVAATGDFALAQGTLTALKEVSEKVNGNGRIIHEMSPFGCIFNYGNTQETAHFIVAVREVFRWTGDIEWLKSIYPYMEKGIDWLFNDMDRNGNMFPEGYGIMEVRGLNAELIDVAVYSQQALECMSEMALIFGDVSKSEEWKAKSEVLKEKIDTCFWDESRNSYCDFFGKSEDAARVARDAAEQYPDNRDYYLALAKEFESLPAGTEKGFRTNGNWVINVPMEVGIAPEDKAAAALDEIRRNSGKYGPYLSSTDKDQWMTISTGVQAVAEASYGRMDQAVEYLDMIAATLHYYLPGSMCEMMPDGGCPAQAWTIYGPARVLITDIFGINPDALNRKVAIDPVLPTGWDKLSISDVKVGDMTFSLSIDINDGQTEYRISTDSPDWVFDVSVPGEEVKTFSGKKFYSVKF